MTPEDIIRMAREAGFHRPVPADGYMGLAYDRREGRETGGSLERFAALVADAEREACAKFADEYMLNYEGKSFGVGNAIRARGETK